MYNYDVQLLYISIGEYYEYFSRFVESVDYFLPGLRKKLTIISDKEPECFNTDKDIDIEIIYCPDMIYPTINVNKTYFIEQFADAECKYLFYFDSNTIFIEKNCDYWLKFIDLIGENGILLTKHPFYALKDGVDYYGLTKECRIYNLYTPNLTERRPFSSAFIEENSETRSVPYVNSAFFGGITKDVIRICKCVTELEKTDLQRYFGSDIDKTYHIPQFIDENYFNKIVCSDFKNDFNIRIDSYSKLYDGDNMDIDSIFMYQKGM